MSAVYYEKSRCLIMAFFGALVLIVCGCDNNTVTPHTYAVTVSSNGTGATGTGSYPAGATVSISAGIAPIGQKFKNWITSNTIVIFDDVNSAETNFIMPVSAVIVTAVFEAECGVSCSDEKQFNPDITYGEITDSRDGKKYKTVVIGSQVWMAENLNYDTANGTGSWCYGNNASNCDTYGRLYDWNTAMVGALSSIAVPSGVQGICLSDWHLPSDAEWAALVTEVTKDGSNAGTALKSATYWQYYSAITTGTNEFGFSAVPGGARWSDFRYAGRGFWWTATEYDAGDALSRRMDYDYEHVDEDGYNKSYGFSVRCVSSIR